MTRRNLGTTAILAVAGVLLIGGMAFAREAERDDEGGAPPGATQTDAPTNPSQSASAAPSFDDNGGNRVGSDDSIAPSATAAPSFDDNGGNRVGSDDPVAPSATAAPSSDDNGGDDNGGDDNGGHGGDDNS